MKKIILIIIFCSMIAFNANAARPAPPTITILNEPSGGFQLGDTIKLMAISTEDVTEMQCWAFFENKLNTEYNGYADAYYAGNNQYRADFEFTVTE